MIPTSIRRLALVLLAAACIALPSQAQGSGGTNRPEHAAKPYVVLVSLDGFAADYLRRYPAPNLRRLMDEGARAEGLVPVFPSKTFPNHYSIATGLRPARHGLVANRFWDPERGGAYAVSDRAAVEDGSWYRGEPLWATAERQGMVAGSVFWVGTEAPIGGVQPTFWQKYDGALPNAARVDSALAWLALPAERRPHLVLLYMSDVDDAGHHHRPGSPEVGEAILRVDSAIGRLLDGIEALPLVDSVFVVVVSDHGMATYTPATAVDVGTLLDTAGVMVADAGPNANLHVRGGPARAREVRDALNRGLRHGRAYLREEVPARLAYRSDPRIGDVVVIMELPYILTPPGRLPDAPGGTHGWDSANPAMRGIFLARGPGIAAGRVVPAFENVDLYPFVAEVLGLVPAAGIDGRAGWLRAAVMGESRW